MPTRRFLHTGDCSTPILSFVSLWAVCFFDCVAQQHQAAECYARVLHQARAPGGNILLNKSTETSPLFVQHIDLLRVLTSTRYR